MKKRAFKKIRQSNRQLILILLALTLLSSPVFAAIQTAEILSAPDLTLNASDIIFSPENPVIGQPVNITAIVRNIGGSDAKNVTVDFYIDSTESIVQKVIDEIHSDSQKSSSINFIFLIPGSYNVTVKIDADNKIIEQNETNNQATKLITIAGIVTKPSSISLSAYPEVIKANGIDTSTITAIVTDELGRMVNGTEVTFSTTLGSIDSPKTTVHGIATTILTSSTSPGTAVVGASAIIKGTPVSDTLHVAFIETAEAKCNETIENTTTSIEGTTVSMTNTTVTVKDGAITINVENATIIVGNVTAGSVISILIEGGKLEITLEENATAVNNNTVTGNISKIKLNTPAESYETSKPDVGTVTADLDVEFKAIFTPANLGLTMTLREDYDNLPASGREIKENIIATFGIEGVTPSDIQKNTAIIVHSNLSGTYIANNVTGVPVSITVNRSWFDSVAGGDRNKVTLFKISDNGTVEEIKIPEVIIDSINNTVIFQTTFDHFCVFVLIAKPTPPSLPIYPIYPLLPGGYHPPPLIISNITVTLGRPVIVSWDTNEISDSLVKCGMKPGQYNIIKHDSNYTLSQSIRLEEVNKSGTYFFVVNSTARDGRTAQTNEHVFSYPAPPKPPKPGLWIKSIFPADYYLMIPWWFLFIAIVVILAISIANRRYVQRKWEELVERGKISAEAKRRREEALSELNRKFARGEISVDEYIDARNRV